MCPRPCREVVPIVLRSLLSVLEEVTLLLLPHGGQKTARRNAWRAATDLHVTTGYRWMDTTVPLSVTSVTPAPPRVTTPGRRPASARGRRPALIRVTP
ncbi:hypothetical protein E0F15_05840 [Frankia sp. B2]|uniref:hypothetical protein n=1 Tax=unclassified Frankia TaxID=2632575 RepID=UPI000A2F6200|nr:MULTISPECIES: hypothetical protein [unclassified Frankia]TFE33511.1 hypothetical protein E0F15_05840 [Frankia sp. B2]